MGKFLLLTCVLSVLAARPALAGTGQDAQLKATMACLTTFKQQLDAAFDEMDAVQSDVICTPFQKSPTGALVSIATVNAACEKIATSNKPATACDALFCPTGESFCKFPDPAKEKAKAAAKAKAKAKGESEPADQGDIVREQYDNMIAGWVTEQKSVLPAPGADGQKSPSLVDAATTRAKAEAALSEEANTLSNDIIPGFFLNVQKVTSENNLDVTTAFNKNHSACASYNQFEAIYSKRQIAVNHMGNALNNAVTCLGNVQTSLQNLDNSPAAAPDAPPEPAPNPAPGANAQPAQ